jgi:hypothetical protein
MIGLVTAAAYIATGLGFALYLGTWTFARSMLTRWPERWFGIGLLIAPLGFLLTARALQSGAQSESGALLLGAMAAFFISTISVATGVIRLSRTAPAGETTP